MRKTIYTLITLGAILMAAACNDYETYGELKERERDAIDQFINDSGYVIISQDQFEEQGNKTIGDKQFVQLNKSGVYMQIVNVGSGETIKDGESMNILCRFIEKSILDTVKLSNYTNDNQPRHYERHPHGQYVHGKLHPGTDAQQLRQHRA